MRVYGGHAEDMTAVGRSINFFSNNIQAFETCIATTLQVVAAMEFGKLLAPEQDRPTKELLVACAVEVERNALDVARLAGGVSGIDVREMGQSWYDKLTALRDEPVQAAYHAIHAAVYLGLDGGEDTARMLGAVGCALRVLAEREGRLSN